ncbi:MAG: M28 family peptidase [Oscillospiraceae bacterium]|nr:M28 family peptidase [Oscillospiraceae bacterium]
MDTCGKREYALLEKIGFVRVSGSEEEKKAAEMLAEEVRALGVEAELEPFTVTHYEVKKVRFEMLEPEYREIEVLGYGYSGCTPEEGITAEFAYVQGGTPNELKNVRGKIVMTDGRMMPNVYERIIKAGAAGFVTWSGTVIDDVTCTDIDKRELREPHWRHGKCPGVTMRAKDAMELVRANPKTVRLTLVQEESERNSHNVIATLPGTDLADEEICFVAHYDSTPYSPGVYDNLSGSAIILEMMRHYIANPPRRSLRFVWFGSEERGLLGSKYYVEAHENELEKMQLLINVDMAGPVLGVDRAFITADVSLQHMVDYLGAEAGFPIQTVQDVYSSDSTPFAGKGVPAISFARFGAQGAAPGHNRFDLLEHLSAESLDKTTGFVRLFSDRIIGSEWFPVPRTMPDNMLEAIDNYLHRWDKK